MNIQPSTPYMIEFLGTPEAGKTSVIHQLKKELSKSFSVEIIRESAEIVPEIIPKGSIEAHFWMKYRTLTKLLEAKFCTEYDVILIDRGIVDSMVWNQYYYSIKAISREILEICNAFFTHSGVPNPDQIVYLTTTPEEAIKRRGGEGRIVTYRFVSHFNNIVNSFMQQYSQPFFKLDTTNLTKQEKFDIVLSEITKNLQLPYL
ncbi:MAG: ATP-binding protein [Clostridia bacterium]|nr:ATP-binding protein [Clostridia bacterium]MBR3324930.1 ATP-binding protein [Clostridia bacterium]